jgi:hypothetical protein
MTSAVPTVSSLRYTVQDVFVVQRGYLAAVPLGLGNTATDAMSAHSEKVMPPAQSPNSLTVQWDTKPMKSHSLDPKCGAQNYV